MSDLSRRDAIKIIGAAAGAVGISALPDAWEKPVVEAANLPAVSQASPVPTATLVPTATATAAPTATAIPTATAAPSPTPTLLSVTITTPNNSNENIPVYETPGVTFIGTSTPGSTVTISIDGAPGLPAVSTPDGATDGWSLTTTVDSSIRTRHTVEATATKPPSVPAHAGPVTFAVFAPPA
jgi:hypothetical protein